MSVLKFYVKIIENGHTVCTCDLFYVNALKGKGYTVRKEQKEYYVYKNKEE